MKRTIEEVRDFIERESAHLPYTERQDFRVKAMTDWYNELEVGDKAHIKTYTDISPCTVIKRTAKSITVRVDKAVLDPTWKPEFIPGGFSAHCVNNNEQRWIITDDPNGEIEVFRFHKNVGWVATNGLTLYPKWMKFYDYNF